MPSTKDIKRRQKSVKNTQQVTRAMQMVAASKMRKSQIIALQARPFAENALSVLSNIKAREPELKNRFLSKGNERGGASKKIIALVITSDKGLCGGLNSAVIKESKNIFSEYKEKGYDVELVLVGTKSRAFFQKTGLKIHGSFNGVGDYADVEEIKPISELVRRAYLKSRAEKVIAVYTEFISTLKQKVARRQVLPIHEDMFRDLVKDIMPENGKLSEVNSQAAGGKLSAVASQQQYIFEPGAKQILRTLIPYLLDIYIYHIILESNASEHSARMVSMKNASENAENILKELTLSYNKTRQANITREIAEITSGAEALAS